MAGKGQSEKMLSAEDIFAADDITTKPVPVPEWGGVVYVREMSAADREVFENFYFDVDAKDVAVRLLVLTVTDVFGERLFSEDDVPTLSQKASGAVKKVYDAALELNALGSQAVEEKKGN